MALLTGWRADRFQAGLTGRRSPLAEHTTVVAGIALALAVGTFIVYITNGTSRAYPYVMLVPVIVGAAYYGLSGGVLSALAAGLLLGPVMPLSVHPYAAQSVGNWGARIGFFILIGATAGWLYRQMHQYARAVARAARVDASTGLPNQLALGEAVESLLAREAESPPPVAVTLVRATDLDDLIDLLGVTGSDDVIRELGRKLEKAQPGLIGPFRFSTSELAFVSCPDGEESLDGVTRELHRHAGRPVRVNGVPVRLEPVIGMGLQDSEPAADAQELIRRARVALRRATISEADWVTYEPALESGTAEEMALIARVPEALQRGEFELHYQPKVELASGTALGVEALLRWREPDGRLIPPDAFLPKLEHTSLIAMMSRFVIREAVAFALHTAHIPVSINLAPRNLVDEELITSLIRRVRQSGLPPSYFDVEVTESAIMRDTRKTIALMQRLREQGLGVSIDDFGTGYASFAYLQQLPVTSLKIDRFFVATLERDPKSWRIVQAMIEVADALGLTVVAEGVETADQARLLTDLGCHAGQGFYWSPALPPPDLLAWLDRHRA